MTAPNSTPLEPSPLPGQTSNFALLASSKTPLQNPSPLSSTPSSRVSSKKLISPISAVTLNSDPDIVPLLRVQRELEKQLREVKEELEIAEQARKIEYESAKWTRRDGDGEGEDEIDGELVELIEKWRGASRLAAEELFGMVRDRVNR
jgi:Swi5-dependent recombination DNA repair protein 1